MLENKAEWICSSGIPFRPSDKWKREKQERENAKLLKSEVVKNMLFGFNVWNIETINKLGILNTFKLVLNVPKTSKRNRESSNGIKRSNGPASVRRKNDGNGICTAWCSLVRLRVNYTSSPGDSANSQKSFNAINIAGGSWVFCQRKVCACVSKWK